MPAETTVRVRYKDTDVMGIVYYGNYLTYFEVGRVEYLRERGYPMSEVQRKIYLPVVEASAKYHRPARLDDLLRIRTWVGERRRASFTFHYAVHHGETHVLIATGQTRHCCLEPESQKLVSVPQWLGTILPVEKGEPPDN